MTPGLIVLLLSLLLGLQPITTDLYLPALPLLTEGFAASMAQAQLTLTALLLAFGLSQLIWGPLSDRFGRRPILLIGMSAYVLASIASTLSSTMEMLIVWRALQGAAMGAGVMCARAIVRDLYAPAQGARVMSKGLSGLGLIACLSPPLGGLLADLFNWRISLLTLAIFGAISLALIALHFEETLPKKNLQALQGAHLLQTWLLILRNPTFVAFSALATASYGCLFTFLASSSFVFIKVLGLSTTHYGLLVFSMAFSYLLGTFLCRYLLNRFDVRRTVAIAGVLSLSGGTIAGVLALLGWKSAWTIMPPFYLFMLGHGIQMPCSQSGVVGPFPQSAGAASALNGFLMMLAVFLIGNWLGTHMDGSIFPLVYGIWFWSAMVALIAWTLVQKQGRRGAS